ncbi:MAG: S-layer homology domain-containing protein, partial [Clostridia bacterium]|nr:S-layer homology domain-containing protein [Clostridia bacterium]
MRNLKKVLALVLVFAMMLSTCVVASAASFPDVEATYQYAEAIDLLASLNILGGYEDGTFKPENNITRAEFAKVVYVIFNGMDDVNAQMYVSDSQFNDVAKNQWFNGHVNWASENSIVGGYGDGTFLPSNNVAVKEAIKMVVTAVTDKALTYPNGYIQEARALKLLEDVTVGDTSAPATRGQVAQLAYNLLFTPSRLCLVDTGTMDFYGNEILAKKAPIDFVFGLKSVKNVTLAATYNTTFLSGTSATLEEGQVELVANGTGEGYTLPAGTTYDYAGNAEDLFGQQLKAYFNSDNELVALVSVSDVVGETTAEKLVGDGTYSNPFGITIGEYKEVEVSGKKTKSYFIDTVYEQNPDGTWGTPDTDVSLETLTDGRKFNNNNAKVTLIDTPDENEVLDGVVDTVLVEYQATTQVRRYNKTAGTISITGKTLTFANAIGHEAFADADYLDEKNAVFATYTVKSG